MTDDELMKMKSVVEIASKLDEERGELEEIRRLLIETDYHPVSIRTPQGEKILPLSVREALESAVLEQISHNKSQFAAL